jgi:hypothetical protein
MSNKTNPISRKISFQKLGRTDNNQTVSLTNQYLLEVSRLGIKIRNGSLPRIINIYYDGILHFKHGERQI